MPINIPIIPLITFTPGGIRESDRMIPDAPPPVTAVPVAAFKIRLTPYTMYVHEAYMARKAASDKTDPPLPQTIDDEPEAAGAPDRPSVPVISSKTKRPSRKNRR